MWWPLARNPADFAGLDGLYDILDGGAWLLLAIKMNRHWHVTAGFPARCAHGDGTDSAAMVDILIHLRVDLGANLGFGLKGFHGVVTGCQCNLLD